MSDLTIKEKITNRVHRLLDDLGEASPRDSVFLAQAIKELYLALQLENSSGSQVDWLSQLTQNKPEIRIQQDHD